MQEASLTTSDADRHIQIPGVYDEHAFAAEVSGDSMEPEYCEGDIVVASPELGKKVKEGMVCIIQFLPDYSEGEGQALRRVYKSGDEKMQLVSANPKYPEITISPNEARAWPICAVIKRLNMERESKGSL